ncbi:YopX family protein [Streptococcus mitis]|uniref:YopX family protein n=1 Tax=Streptococcus mitis TaxID=28037 RepID=UPI0021B7EB85|nr:YopX family protein [Streptococcus mitis]
MIPKYRAYDGGSLNRMYQPDEVMVGNGDIWIIDEDSVAGEWIVNNDIHLMQSTGLLDKNGKEIFEGDILKFNDEWAEYCHEGYVDGSVEGINFVEVVRGEACFEFGKTRYPESSLFIRMEDERLTFAELIKSRDFEFEIIGNVYENPGLLEGKE